MIPKDKNLLTPVIPLHQDLIFLAMCFRKGLSSTVCLRYAVASDRKPSGRTYLTRAPSPVTAKGLVTENVKADRY